MPRTATARAESVKSGKTTFAAEVLDILAEKPLVGETPDGLTQVHPAEVEVEPNAETVAAALAESKAEPVSVLDQMKAHAAEVRAAQSKARKANGTAATKPTAKPKTSQPAAKPAAKASKPKATPKPKAEVKRVPAETFVAELKRLGLTNTQAARALGVSPSSVSEYVGHGRGRTMAQDRWADAKKALAAFAKGLK